MTKLQILAWKSTGYVQDTLIPPQSAVLTLTVKRSQYSELQILKVQGYVLMLNGRSRNQTNKSGPLSCSRDGPQDMKPILCVLCVTHFCHGGHMQCLSLEQILQSKIPNCVRCLTLMQAVCVAIHLKTYYIKGKFDGRPTRSSLASWELELVMCEKHIFLLEVCTSESVHILSQKSVSWL